MRVLSGTEARSLLTELPVVEIVADALQRYSSGKADVPQRLRVEAGRATRESLVMPGYLRDPAVLGLKVVNGFADSLDDATHTTAVILLLDPETGEAEGLIEAAELTAVRTAAMTKLAYDFAAPSGVTSVAMIGSGVQARAHAAFLRESFPELAQVRVFSRTRSHAESFAVDTANEHFEVVAVRTAREAVAGADIVVAATTAHEPVFEDGWVEPGALVCGIGTHTPDAAEIPGSTVARATHVIVDTRVGGVFGAGDILRPLEAQQVAESSIVELGELLCGARVLEPANGNVTVFKSVGTAAADLPLAQALVAAARASGLGTELDFR